MGEACGLHHTTHFNMAILLARLKVLVKCGLQKMMNRESPIEKIQNTTSNKLVVYDNPH